jgi:hypothetical protein
MIDYMLVSNVEEVHLEAEISDGQGKLIATLYEDASGWHLDRIEQDAIPDKFVEQVKIRMQAYVNRKGLSAPEGANRGDMALWLMLKEDSSAMGLPYKA